MPKEIEKTTQELALEAKLAELDAKMTAMLDLEERLKASAPQGGITNDQLERMLTRVTEAAAGPAQVLASKLKPENPDHLHKGPFEHPEGGIAFPKPELVRETTFVGARLRLDELTYAEVLAVNALHASLKRSQRRISRGGKWVAQVSDDDQALTIRVPVKNIDDRGDLPPFIQIMQELATGERAQDVGELAQELALLKAQMANLTAASAH